MRQDNFKFQTALNNLAKGKLQNSDIKLFQRRCFTSLPKNENFHDAIHLFSRNEDVHDYNVKVLNSMKGKETVCVASDIMKGHGSNLAKRQLTSGIEKRKMHQTMGLQKEMSLKTGAMYMMTYNVNTEDGLCNGATGTLKQIDFGSNEKNEKKPLRLWIKFHDESVGQLLRNKYKSRMDNFHIPTTWTPVEPIALTIATRKTSSLKINRKQFPLTLAHAITIHKSQGQSLNKVVVHIKKKMTRELLYVALSRATSLEGLYIIGNFPIPKPIPKSSHLRSEIKSWKKRSLKTKFQFLQNNSNSLQIIYHNVQSLPQHINLIKNDEVFTTSDILFLGETWTKPTDNFKIKNLKLLQKIDSGNSRKPKGISLYVKKSRCKKVVSSNAYTLKETK